MGRKDKPTVEQYLKWFGNKFPIPKANVKPDPYKEYIRKKPKPPPLKHYDFESWPSKKKAKMMKKILKQEFPEQKFSVVSSRGSTRSIDIGWRDGPSVKDVERLQFWRYNYAMRDGRGGIESNDYVFLNRTYSPELKTKEEKRILSKWADVEKMQSYRKEEIVYREMYQTSYGKAGTPRIIRGR